MPNLIEDARRLVAPGAVETDQPAPRCRAITEIEPSIQTDTGQSEQPLPDREKNS